MEGMFQALKYGGAPPLARAVMFVVALASVGFGRTTTPICREALTVTKPTAQARWPALSLIQTWGAYSPTLGYTWERLSPVEVTPSPSCQSIVHGGVPPRNSAESCVGFPTSTGSGEATTTAPAMGGAAL